MWSMYEKIEYLADCVISRRFHIKDFVPIKIEKEVISVRLRSDMIEEIDAAANAADISRSYPISKEKAMKSQNLIAF